MILLDKEHIEEFIKERFGDEISDETKDRLKLLFTCIGEAMDKTVDDMTLDLMTRHSLSLGEARIIALNQMKKLFEKGMI